eukprot:TRINITY_DN3017_c0_g1_i1.p1 TRINITY_DN3017_c0_g1~~TRINITY_DN3017_c0_g1_i1.p1  ORF type:complete len:407 (+),score=64.97 TRINITY_DN3017_c0_g1_i1:36-1256(+)
MADTTTTPIRRVAIIGAGIGGLALAQALRSSENIQVAVYERSESQTSRPQGYLIGLQYDMGLRVLNKINVTPVMSYMSTLPGSGFTVTSSDLKVLVNLFSDPTAKNPRFRLVDRSVIWEGLLDGLDVNWGKRFTRYEEDEDLVRVFFEDGTSIECDILVGADGAKSKVRDQRLPGSSIEPVPIFNVCSTLENVPKEEMPEISSILSEGACRVLGPEGYSFLILRMSPADSPNLTAMWALTAPDNCGLSDMLGSNSLAKAGAIQVAERCHPALVELITRSTDESVWQMKYSTMNVDNPANFITTTTRVTLMGDAAHLMTTHGGLGANTALVDAEELALALKADDWRSSLRIYEKRMAARGKKNVTTSLRSSRMLVASSGWFRGFRFLGFWSLGKILSVINFFTRLCR